MPFLQVINLKKYFPVWGGLLSHQVNSVKAIDNVSFNINKGLTQTIVGESGCGKTTLSRCILGTLPPTAGTIKFLGEDLTEKKVLKKYRRDIQMVFQDPYSSLNPRMTAADIVWEPIAIHNVNNKRNKEETVIELFKKVGLADYHIYRYPHEFSGGQKQRIAIARSLALNPKLIIYDEPIANLDVSVGAQILNLMADLQKELNLTYLFVSHNLNVVYHISDSVIVMYLGRIVEMAPTEELFKNPLHPYTKALLSAIPIPDPTQKSKRIILKGEVPTPINIPHGCRFKTRCWMCKSNCSIEPTLLEVSNNHSIACHFA